MQWIRSHASFANVVSVMALFVALGGTSVAAVTLAKNSVGSKQIKKNAVRASEIKSNAVGASEIRSNAVAGGDVADGTLGSGDLGDNSVGSGELSANSVGSSELSDNSVGNSEAANNSIGSGELIDGSIALGDMSPDAIGPRAFARVGATGTLDGGSPPQNKGVIQANVQKDAVAGATTTGPGVYCFGGLPFEPRSAVVTADSAGALGTTNLIVSVAVQRGNNLGNCNAAHQQARVSVLAVDQTNAPTLTNHGFYIWFVG
jgi:hypothetical protein